MRIQSEPPFELSGSDTEGVQHAVKGHIQVSVLPDVGEVEMKHRVGQRPGIDAESRWLYINLKDKNLRIYVHGTHVVVAEKELLPTFTTNSREELMEHVFKHMKPGSDENKRPTVDTPQNRRIISEVLELSEIGIRSKLLAGMSHGAAKGVDQ